MACAPLIIAEIGSNHGSSLDIVGKLIDGSKEAGCAFVKFQLFFPDEFIPDYINASDYGFSGQYGEVSWQKVLSDELVFPHDLYPKVREYCKARQIGFGVTVHGARSLEVALRLGVDFIKVASMDMNYYQFLKSLSNLSCPIILSTGMATLTEVAKAVNALEMKRKDVLMHCTSEYPATENNITRIKAFKKLGAFHIGYSDHTEDSIAAVGATCLGATWFEKHITLDKRLPGPDHSFAANLSDLKQYVADIKKAADLLELSEEADPSASQLANRSAYRRSIVASRDLLPGYIISKTDIDFKRPGTGLAPDEEHAVLGARVKQFIPRDALLTTQNLAFD